MLKFAKAITGVVGLVFHLVGTANASDGLYPEPPPKDAAFVRWLDADADKVFPDLDLSEIVRNAYHPISAQRSETLNSGSYYSAAFDAWGRITLVEEPLRAATGKVHLLLLNLTAEPLSLYLADRDVIVISETMVNGAQMRAVNPVNVALDIRNASGVFVEKLDLRLRRGQDVTIVVRPEGAQLVESQFGPNMGR